MSRAGTVNPRLGDAIYAGAVGKLPAQRDCLDLRGASAPASDTGPFLPSRLGCQYPIARYGEYIRGPGICKLFTFARCGKNQGAERHGD